MILLGRKTVFRGCLTLAHNIEDLEQSVIDYFLKNRTRATLLSFNLVARLDGPCDTIEKKYYQKQLLKVIAGKGKI